MDALWITPFYPSPMVDHGYDVADLDRTMRFDNGVHALHRGLRRTLEDYPGAMAVGEIWVAAQTRGGIERSIASLRAVEAPTCWVLSNHDRPRHRSR